MFPEFLVKCGNILARQTSTSLLVLYQTLINNAGGLREILLPAKADCKIFLQVLAASFF